MGWARTGTVSFTNGSITVTGVGTQFLVELRQGDGIRGPDGLIYEAANLVSNTQLTLGQPYAGATAANQPLWVVATQGYLQKTGDELRDWTNKAGLLVDSESLQALSEVSGTANAVPIFDGIDQMSTFILTPLGRAIATASTVAQVKTQLALDNVNNTSDASKPISTATQNALNLKMRNSTVSGSDTTTDLNTINQAGPYTTLVGTTNPNIPEAALFYPFNFVHSNGSWIQILFPYGVSNSGNIWYRTFYVGNSNPNPWRRVLASSELVTAISDTTAGRILTVGFMGLGGSSLLGGTVDAVTPSGFYGYSVSGVVPGHTYFNLLNIRWGGDGNWASQLVMGVGNNELAYRAAHTSSSNSAPWARIITSRNATLPVGSDLNLAGGIMEFGSNASGSYWKFANGMLICAVEYTGYTQNQAKSTSWPHSFIGTPRVVGNVIPSGYWNYNFACYGTTALAWFNTPEVTTSLNAVYMVGIGRWY